MPDTTDTTVLLTVRGKLIHPTEPSRKLHNETAGSEPGIAAARALSDLSHKVYLPASKAGEHAGTSANEALFIDLWGNPGGLQEFFSNKNVIEQGAKLFSEKDPTVWMPAKGSYGFHFEAPTTKKERFVGLLRGPVKSPEQAIQTFGAMGMKRLADARKRGQLSHAMYFKLTPPGTPGPVEMLGIDLWCDFEGMMQHYAGDMGAIEGALAGKPQTSLWQQPEGSWSEW